jgi:hypothetical protein
MKGRLFMKKILLALLVLSIAVPAMGAVTITMRKGAAANEVIVGYSWTGTGDSNEVRAFALNVAVTDKAYIVGSATRLSTGYYVTPSNITFMVVGPNTVINQLGSPVAAEDANGGVIEMASLYAANDPCATRKTAPPSSGDLVKFLVDCAKRGTDQKVGISLTVNTLRGGVVVKDGNSVTPTLPTFPTTPPGTLWICMTAPPACVGCPGQSLGDTNLDGKVTVVDLANLKKAWTTTAAGSPHGTGPGQFNCCCDFNHDNKVTIVDLAKLKLNWSLTVSPPCTTGTLCP